jgi:SAM-dependent methyltransferase
MQHKDINSKMKRLKLFVKLLYNEIIVLLKTGRFSWKLKQLLGLKYSNTDFVVDHNNWLNLQLKELPCFGQGYKESCWHNLIEFSKTLRVENSREKIECRKLELPSPPSLQTVPYSHNEQFQNHLSANRIVDLLYPVLKPKSVVDVGCGLGNFLKAFKDKGAMKVLGVNGDWVPREKLFKNIGEDEFIVWDLNNPLFIKDKFSLVICLEVAEHLRKESAEILIRSLTLLGDIILFSAATPLTWYDGSHLNNQWPPYWRHLFKKYNFEMHDVVRHIFVNAIDVFPWYKQNMFLVTKMGDYEIVRKFNDFYPKKKYITRVSDIFYPQLE